MAAVPSAAFVVAVSMIERRAARARPPGPAAVPGQDEAASSPSWPGRPPSPRTARTRPSSRQRAAPPPSTRPAHGQPITRDALRARLGTSTQAASDLLRQLRASDTALPPGVARLDQARRAPGDPQP